MKYLLIIIAFFITFIFTSCNDEGMYSNDPSLIIHVRAIVLENNTISYCTLDSREKEIYHPGDTVWLDMSTHRINDTSTHTMKVILKDN